MTEVEAAPGWRERVDALVGKPYGKVLSWDPITAPAIRAWCQAMGVDAGPYLAAGTAPQTMLQVWTMVGQTGKPPTGSSEDNFYEVLDLLTEAGFTGVLAVNSEQAYDRVLKVGDEISFTSVIESVSEEKTTRLGRGVFVQQTRTFFDQHDQRVATMAFRLLKFRPKAATQRPAPPQPGISDDTAFFWEGTAQGRLMVQQCGGCKRLRHPPGPACPRCHGLDWDPVPVSGRGTVYSYVVAHHPRSPAFPEPNPIVLVDLEEGVRLMAGIDAAPDAIRIGMPVEAVWVPGQQGVTLPRFKPAA